ncbi:hypothetical protein IWQ56_005292 [Coemansia nantahalensis]|uniref:Uncharacterized protein n=1 Tax=Coemansia nantahalensis TaxID=2789366 RepID=A0ACC1JVW0_9FUNG|nr:hypothetical protein IWQ56_005292 [Coemansia nantahalensis]KAJ2768327.1 hypothetical protein IWQ57_003585 [Coemansia nantahalensis]
MAEEHARPAAQPASDDADHAFGSDDDGFGSFDEGAGGHAAAGDDDDFGDFGDFGAVAPEPEPTAEDAGPPQGPVESTLARLDALLSRPPDSDDDRLKVLDDCLERVLGPAATSPEAPAAHGDPSWLLSEDAVQRAVAGGHGDNEAAAAAAAEPRLLRNLILATVSSDLAAADRSRLLTPLADLKRRATTAEAGAQAPGPLPIDQIRLLAAQDEPGADQAALLRRALASIDLLVAAKAEEVAKRKDAVDAYNQVIQALVAQASKLH